MNTQHAFELEAAAAPATRSVPDQLQLNRIAVDHAEYATLNQSTHPARWERRGFLRRLAPRDPGRE